MVEKYQDGSPRPSVRFSQSVDSGEHELIGLLRGSTGPSFIKIPNPNSTKAVNRLARAKYGGTATKDKRELPLRKGEYLTIISEMSEFWYIVRNKEDKQGWVHSTWVTLLEEEPQGPVELYSAWKARCDAAFAKGSLTTFPELPTSIRSCKAVSCANLKTQLGNLGVCQHDVASLLRGSGKYSYKFLKTERNSWHPDKFGQQCAPGNREELKKKSEQLFIIYGLLMETEAKKNI